MQIYTHNFKFALHLCRTFIAVRSDAEKSAEPESIDSFDFVIPRLLLFGWGYSLDTTAQIIDATFELIRADKLGHAADSIMFVINEIANDDDAKQLFISQLGTIFETQRLPISGIQRNTLDALQTDLHLPFSKIEKSLARGRELSWIIEELVVQYIKSGRLRE